MVAGGPRNRSGPAPDPTSARSESRGINIDLTALPSEGFTDAAPTFPLPPTGVKPIDDREAIQWAAAWSTPQAAAWAVQLWRVPIVAEYVRLMVRCEANDAHASVIAQLHRYRDQLGLTPAGLRDNGWRIAPNEVAKRSASRGVDAPAPTHERRLRVASGANGLD
jgi:hypothetical protein